MTQGGTFQVWAIGSLRYEGFRRGSEGISRCWTLQAMRQFYQQRLQSMNDYLTPRRRHSSLFQRMEDEINKISKKLSAAKQHKENHQPTSARKYVNHDSHSQFKKYQIASPDDGAEETVRRTKPNDSNSKEITKKLTFFKDRTNQTDTNTRGPIRRLKFASNQPMNLQEELYDLQPSHHMSKILQQNKQLQRQLKKMNAICEQQAFKIGYLRAENRQHDIHINEVKHEFKKQQLYLNKLVEGYRLKVNKYKQILNDEESLELSIADL